MKKAIILLILTINSLILLSQNLQYSSDDITISKWIPDKYWSHFDSRDMFPERINEIVDTNLKRWFGNYGDRIAFDFGVAVDLDSYYRDMPDAIFDNHYFVPAFGFFFQYSDSSVGIKKYDLVMSFDSYGHLYDMNFPMISGLNCPDFLSLDEAKHIADSLNNQQIPDFEEYNIGLYVDDCIDDFYWEFMYGDGAYEKGSKSYYCAISLITGQIIQDKTGIEVIDSVYMNELIEGVEFEEEIIKLR